MTGIKIECELVDQLLYLIISDIINISRTGVHCEGLTKDGAGKLGVNDDAGAKASTNARAAVYLAIIIQFGDVSSAINL